mmetsp:Transcript_35781/g.88020  ORF Transcript_35781/g.88020 Transcript_35781/m.88020 type:complete len:243 (-) Transcript_35781:46-774(-)
MPDSERRPPVRREDARLCLEEEVAHPLQARALLRRVLDGQHRLLELRLARGLPIEPDRLYAHVPRVGALVKHGCDVEPLPTRRPPHVHAHRLPHWDRGHQAAHPHLEAASRLLPRVFVARDPIPRAVWRVRLGPLDLEVAHDGHAQQQRPQHRVAEEALIADPHERLEREGVLRLHHARWVVHHDLRPAEIFDPVHRLVRHQVRRRFEHDVVARTPPRGAPQSDEPEEGQQGQGPAPRLHRH